MFWQKNKIVINLESELATLRKELEQKCRDVVAKESERRKLNEELEDLKLKKKIELQEIEHMVKMSKERNEISFEKKVAEVQSAKQKEIYDLQKGYYEKAMGDLKGLMEQIMARLPNVNMEIKKSG